jgi:hypothetical protein
MVIVFHDFLEILSVPSFPRFESLLLAYVHADT